MRPKKASLTAASFIGDNALAQTANHKIRLYVRTWENPKPDEKVVSINFLSARTSAAPFCVAMTVSDR